MRNKRLLVIIILFLIIGALINPFGLLKPIKNYTNVITSPITGEIYQTTIAVENFFHTLFSLGNLIKENNSSKGEIAKLKSDNIKLNEMKFENNLLREELKFSQSTRFQLIASNIISKSPDGLINSVTINKGSKDGIKKDQAVISQGFLVGRIGNVYKQSSEVSLITSNISKVPAYLQDSRGTGIVRGGLKGLSLEDIPLDVMPKKNEAILTSDIGNILPSGIPIGNVDEVSLTQNDLSHSAKIKSPISFSHLEMIFVIKQ